MIRENRAFSIQFTSVTYWCVTSAVCWQCAVQCGVHCAVQCAWQVHIGAWQVQYAYMHTLGIGGDTTPLSSKKELGKGAWGGSLTRRWGLNPPKMCRPAALNDKFKALKLKLSNIGIRKQTSHEFNFEGSGTPTPQILKQIDATCLSL